MIRLFNSARFLGVLTVLAVAISSADASPILLDFGRADNTSGATYNNISITTGATASSGIIPLVDMGGGATGWSINVVDAGSGNTGSAGVGADVTTVPSAVSGFEATAYGDSIFANGATPGIDIFFTGLNDALTYDLLFYGSRLNGQNIVDQTWTVTEGVGATPVMHASLNNTATVVNWPGLNTNGSGEITVQIRGTGLGALALNVGSISAIPEPSSLGLVLLGGLFVARKLRDKKND